MSVHGRTLHSSLSNIDSYNDSSLLDKDTELRAGGTKATLARNGDRTFLPLPWIFTTSTTRQV